jgi:quinoprotein glucose dehydrogenase
VPALNGMYLYADYVSGNIWALEHKGRKVIANHSISNLNDSGENLPIITFGEDEDGEVYLTTQMGGGQIFKFKSGQKK